MLSGVPRIGIWSSITAHNLLRACNKLSGVFRVVCREERFQVVESQSPLSKLQGLELQ